MRSLETSQKKKFRQIIHSFFAKPISLVLILFAFMPFCLKSEEVPLAAQIAAVERGLLPVNIFAGESPYQLQERMKFYQTPGLSITVIKDSRILWTKTYGVADYDLQNPVTKETLFSVGSLSKGITALTVLSLIHKGQFKLDDDVNQLLTSWTIPENEFTRRAVITPALLMNHSSGAMHHFGVGYFRDRFPTITEVLKGIPPSNHKPTVIVHEPGTRFLYSNPGYAILQQIVEDVTGKPLATVARENVFDKLDMNHTTMEQPLPPDLEKFAAAGHGGYSVLSGKRHYSANQGAGGLWTTSRDYALYVIELQKSWHGKSNRIISQQLTREMLSPHVAKEYGYGVFMRNPGKERYFGHMGDNSGFMSGFISHTSDGYGAVILTNSRKSPELIREINKSIAAYYGWAEFVSGTIRPVDIDMDTLKELSGRFRSGADSVIDIGIENGNLILKSLGNEKMFHIGNNTFKIKRRDGEIRFVRDSASGSWTALYHFADELGRLSGEKRKIMKMKAGEKIPSEILLAGDCEAAARLYEEIFRKDPGDNAVSENRLNSMGYRLLGQDKLAMALCIFKLNTEFYPGSANVHDSYGEALAKSGQKAAAIRQYEMALKLNPRMQNAVEMLKKLKRMK